MLNVSGAPEAVFQHAAARRRLMCMAASSDDVKVFQHAAARRRLIIRI